MLVIRKEVKVGLGIAAAVLGVAVIYGGMSLLTSDRSQEDAISFTPGDAETLAVGGSDLDEAVSGLPPAEGTESAATTSRPPVDDIFAESSRNDGNANANLWSTAWNTGQVGAAIRTETPTPPTPPTNVIGPVVTETPDRTEPIIPGLVTPEATESRTSTPSPTPAAGTYTIATGDTYSSIAGKLYGNRNLYHVIEKANPTVDPRKLKVGQTINVPAASTVASVSESVNDTRAITGTIDASKQYRVQPGDTLHKISQKLYGKTKFWSAIYDANKQAIGPDAGRIKIGMVLNLPHIPTAD